jgi:cell wall-associated NlpC family hydrolase
VAVSLPRLTLLESIAAAAQRFPGVTYTWGGVSSYGFDCSGFVQMIFRQCGVTLPRDAALQAEWVGLRTVDDGQPELGDVVFFGPEAGVVDHVGVSLGGMRFLHDTTRGVPGVQIGALDEARWRERFLLRRRLIA